MAIFKLFFENKLYVLTVPNLKTASWYLYINQTDGTGSTNSSLLGIKCICIFCR